MDNNDNMLNEILAGLRGRQPQLTCPDRLVEEVLMRIETEQKHTKLVIALRIACVAASFLLISGMAAVPDNCLDGNAPVEYQNKYLCQRVDRDYVRSKLIDKQIYDIIRNQESHEKNR